MFTEFTEFTNNYLKYFINEHKSNFDYIKQEKNNIRIKKIEYSIEEYILSDNKIYELLDSKFVFSFDYSNLNTNYRISWFYKVEHNIYIKTTPNVFNNFKKRLNILINVINYIYDKKKTNKNNKINIYLILSELKKYLPTNNQVLDVEHVNSGYTCFQTNKIICWRLEEFEKVLFHELIHYMDLDERHHHYDNIKSLYNIKQNKNYYEAITDFYGILYHTIYLSFIINKSVNRLFQIEYNFIKNQAFMLYDYLNLENTNIINQETSAFSYYILKYLIFKNILENNNINLLDDPKKLILNMLNTKIILQKYIKLKSLRMTILQLL